MTDPTLNLLLINTGSRDDRLEKTLTLEGVQVSGCGDNDMLPYLLREPFDLIVITISSMACISTLTIVRNQTVQRPVIALVHDKEDIWQAAVEADVEQLIPAERPMPQLVAMILSRIRQQEVTQRIGQERDRLLRALEGCRDGVWDWNLETNKVYYSPGWRIILGLRLEDTLDRPDDWFKLVHPDDLGMLRSRLAVHIEGVTPHFEYQCRIRTHVGKYKWVLARGMASRDEDASATGITGTLTDLTNRSHHDIRTGLPFRSFFVDRLNQAIVESQLTPCVFSVLQLDIDRFTAISEGFGNELADALVIAIARRIETCLKPGDTLAFLGGNSFVLMLADEPGLKIGLAVSNQIHMQLIAPFRIKDTDVFSKASIGITAVDGTVNNPNEILRQAHGAMKAARKMGSGHSHIFDKTVASEIHEYLLMESNLRTALDREEFELYYQPQVSMSNGRIVGVETLIRWRDKDGNYISPGKFIPVAEETDLILTIGEWVLRGACQQAVIWQKLGLPPLRVAVNLSERQFRARNLVAMVDSALRETGMQAENLELEITESLFMEDAESTFEILRQLRKRGIKIALDDFGTGFSSLSYLKKFPLTTLKIDRAFVTDIMTDAGDAAICSSIISLAHKFKFSVIAEGIETREQLIILRAFQCDEVQGFYYSKAVPAENLEALLRKQMAKTRN